MTHENPDPFLFRRLLDETLDWETFHDPTGRVVYSSPASIDLIGFTPTELHADQSCFLHRIHPDDVAVFRAHETAVARAHCSGEMTFRYIMPDGTVKWIFHKCGPVFDDSGSYLGQRGSNRDVSRLKETEWHLEQRIRMLRGLTTASSQLIQLPFAEIRVGMRRILQRIAEVSDVEHISILEFTEETDTFRVSYQWYAPAAGERMAGDDEGSITARLPWLAQQMRMRQSVCIDSTSEVPSEAVEEITRAEARAFASNLVVPLLRGDDIIGGLSLTTFRGRRVWSPDDSVFFRIVADLISSFLCRMLDEARSMRQTTDLQNAYIALEMAMRTKDNFLSSVSHELRTPLTNILGLTDMLNMQQPPLTDRQLHYVQIIGESGRHLLAMINDILDVAKIESGTISIEPVEILAREILVSVTHIVQQLAEQRHQTLLTRVEPPELTIVADPMRLTQMMTNLLSNAITFTPEYGTIEVTIGFDSNPGFVCIAVRDTGIGIEPGDVPRLFHPFSQLKTDARLTRSTKGTGLGLVLVKRMADMHGGSVSVESEPGVGSVFRIHLPAKGPG